MMDYFEQGLLGDIPLVDASAFFVGVRNQGWPRSHAETFDKVAAAKTEKERRTMAALGGLAGGISPTLLEHSGVAKRLGLEEAKAGPKSLGRTFLRYGVPIGAGTAALTYAMNKPKQKTAAARKKTAQEIIEGMRRGEMPEGKAGHFKTASVNVRPPGLTDRQWFHEFYGANHEHYRALQKQAQKTDPELREVGRQRAVTSLAAEAHRERGRRGERVGETLGKAVGALGGAGVGGKFLGKKLGPMAGLAAGYGIGGKAGKELGTERDIRKNA
jgi:hypothetical protein